MGVRSDVRGVVVVAIAVVDVDIVPAVGTAATGIELACLVDAAAAAVPSDELLDLGGEGSDVSTFAAR